MPVAWDHQLLQSELTLLFPKLLVFCEDPLPDVLIPRPFSKGNDQQDSVRCLYSALCLDHSRVLLSACSFFFTLSE